MACTSKPIKAARTLPNWSFQGVATLQDPKYGKITLVYQGLPLHSWKSEALPDGSYWMWLGWSFTRASNATLTGRLFFARSWETWQPLALLSVRADLFQSTWQGQDGNGRMKDQEVTITASPEEVPWS